MEKQLQMHSKIGNDFQPICVCNWDWEYILKLYNDEIKAMCMICGKTYGSGSVRQSSVYMQNI